ncbi:MAG: UDP-N-acetylmuramoyl-L-alanyl-D-glutamate--2,6-diaminopimelate ligase [Actinobacteria bacterium]|nr:UDP-N-acetylmuramoyl-L-alanyl-D-glutamate--2,6-diaminopimelate ligase [Actinomycetota bacterium]
MIRPTVAPKSVAALAELVGFVGEPNQEAVISGITLDSRRVADGDLYGALAGAHVHGATFAKQAVNSGAAAILTDQAGADIIGQSKVSVPVLVVEDPRARLGRISSWIYGNPSAALQIIGVTGTDGKTTVAMLAEAGLRAAGLTTGLVGTVLTRIGDQTLESVRTTPEAPDLHALLAVMVEHGVQAVAMEVSSHALALGRVSGVEFDVVVFTNLGHDHLDFHGDQEHYFQAKASLFTPEYAQQAVVCTDGVWGRRLAKLSLIPTTTFAVPGEGEAKADLQPDWTVADIDTRAVGWEFLILSPTARYQGGCQLPGMFNVSNALGAVAAVSCITGDPAAAAFGVADSPGVPGRMEQVGAGTQLAVLVDYAHTPDAVVRALGVGRTIATARGGRLIVVLGCGGDRDREKRPLMGAAAAEGADLAIITDDNPRSEDPAGIRREMMAGMAPPAPGTHSERVEIGGRSAALTYAVQIAEPNDVILALGKGHETTQEIDGVKTPLDDREVLAAALKGTISD